MADNKVEGMRLDSHKMIYHPETVANWLNGKNIYPINMEIGLSGACNHRCYFCAFEYLEYKPIFLAKDVVLRNMKDLAGRGLKSVLYAGFGEPLLHAEAADIMHETKAMGIDVALSTNGVLFNEERQKTCLADISWIRFSVAAPTERTYDSIHHCAEGDLAKVVRNIETASAKKTRENLDTTLGIQMLILPESVREIPLMAKMAKEWGVDYLSVKPFNQGHKVKKDKVVAEELLEEMYYKAKEQETESFKVMMRKNLMEQHKLKHTVNNTCGMLDFFCIINADGTVIPCTVFPGNEEFVYGNINENMFHEIWGSDRCTAIKRKINEEVFAQYCLSEDCKMRMQNAYLHQLKNPHAHVNFI